jgi:hypothetical protein
MAKISQIKLTNTTYDIDVASDLKATKIIGEDLAKITPVEAVQKPDGVNPLFDENNKISSHYISDTILGQLKFGGTLTGYNFFEGSYIVNPSQSILSKLYELTNYPEDSAPIDSLKLSQVGDPSCVSITMISNGEVKNGYGDNDGTAFEGFYFISASNLANGHAVGDWLVINNKNFEKIDNTDTITHIDSAGTSLLEITGTSGLKLNGFKKGTIGIELTDNLYTQANGCITCSGYLYGGSISGGSIAASSKMTAPTITDASDKTQVVNLDYFENNATKVDWENIDSDVRIINGHNFKIQGTYTEQNIGCGVLPSSLDSIEPQRDSSTGQWEWGVDNLWTSPYWGYFEIKKNCRYIVKPVKTSGPFNNAECLDSGASVLVSAELSNTPLLELTSEDHDLIYQPSVYDEGSWEPSFGGYIEFKAPIDGFAFFGASDSFDPVLWVVLERVFEKEASAEIEGDLKVTGDIEVTGDLSFGTDSHLVFGTIEGTDFIADYAKVKNAPTEADDVVNKAYFDANKGSGGGTGIPAPAFPPELNSNYLVLSDIGEINNLDWRTGTYTGILDPKATYELYLEATDGTWIRGILPALSGSEMNNVHFQVTGYTAMTCMNTGWVNGTNKNTNYVNLSGITRRADGFYDFQISFFNCCWQPAKVTITKTGGDTQASYMDGAVLRWRNGQAVWEILSNAEDNTF